MSLDQAFGRLTVRPLDMAIADVNAAIDRVGFFTHRKSPVKVEIFRLIDWSRGQTKLQKTAEIGRFTAQFVSKSGF
jgi:hypothetical protein